MRRKIQKNSQKVKGMGTWMILMSIFIMELLFYTWCRVQCVKVGYQISKEIDNNQALFTLQNNLKIEIAHLKSPQRLEKIAKEKFGLIKPIPEQMITINDSD